MSRPAVHLNRGDGWPMCGSTSERLTTSFDAVTCERCITKMELQPA